MNQLNMAQRRTARVSRASPFLVVSHSSHPIPDLPPSTQNQRSLVQYRAVRTSRVSPFLAASNTPATLFRRATFRSHARMQSWSLLADKRCGIDSEDRTRPQNITKPLSIRRSQKHHMGAFFVRVGAVECRCVCSHACRLKPQLSSSLCGDKAFCTVGVKYISDIVKSNQLPKP